MGVKQDNFGQHGSMYINNTAGDATPPSGMVFVAILAISSGGAEFDQLETADNTNFINTEAQAHNNQTATELGDVAARGVNGQILTTSVNIPKGVTIFGRWNLIDVTSGSKVIAYLGY